MKNSRNLIVVAVVFASVVGFTVLNGKMESSSAAGPVAVSSFPLLGKSVAVESMDANGSNGVTFGSTEFWTWSFSETDVTYYRWVRGNEVARWTASYRADTTNNILCLSEPDGSHDAFYTWSDDTPTTGKVTLTLIGTPRTDSLTLIEDGIRRTDASGVTIASYDDIARSVVEPQQIVLEVLP